MVFDILIHFLIVSVLNSRFNFFFCALDIESHGSWPAGTGTSGGHHLHDPQGFSQVRASQGIADDERGTQEGPEGI